ncbi:D-arabinitol 2-dehydrogenase-like protein 3 [Elsinoe australis]|uniref:D-arabinitol 2-dehydrogenase-like protein 3 n=1 Tax=Elsinoe australis TaxID=40998 RepID=A0A4U7AUE9_9PEZI|nr:D-arabinitol 2-dehydrogenase-like protein 3 [Elsinoe australis]
MKTYTQQAQEEYVSFPVTDLTLGPQAGVERIKSVSSWGHNGQVSEQQFPAFDLRGNVFVVTGAAGGIGLTMAEALTEAGATVYCLDRAQTPHKDFFEAKDRVKPQYGGSLHYQQVNVTDTDSLNAVISSIADKHRRLDGAIAAAAIQQVTPALDYKPSDVSRMLDVNYTGVYMTATAAARVMMKYKCHGSICLVASMSGLVANKGLLSSVYNSSKAAVIQLARNLAMEWGRPRPDGSGGIRVNALSPGHTLTPMVRENLRVDPDLLPLWEKENFLGRIADPEEFKGAAVFLLSRASSFMTGNNLVIDGGHTAW